MFIVCEFCVVSSLSYMYVYIFLLLAFFMCILNVRGMSAREGEKIMMIVMIMVIVIILMINMMIIEKNKRRESLAITQVF